MDKVSALLPYDFIRRMRNWARAQDGTPIHALTLSLGYRSSSAYGERPIPVLFGEASDTQAALNAIAPKYRQVVEQYWRYEGRPMSWHGRHRGIDRGTFQAWVTCGHELLIGELARQAEQRKKKREQLAACFSPIRKL